MSSFDSLASLITRITNNKTINDYNNNNSSNSILKSSTRLTSVASTRAATAAAAIAAAAVAASSSSNSLSGAAATTSATTTGYDLRRASKNKQQNREAELAVSGATSSSHNTNKRKKNHCPPEEDDDDDQVDVNSNGKKSLDRYRTQRSLPVDEEDDELDENDDDDDDELYDEMAINENVSSKKEALSSPDEESSSSSSNNNQREAGGCGSGGGGILVTSSRSSTATSRRQVTDNSSQRKTRSQNENSAIKPSSISSSLRGQNMTPHSTNHKLPVARPTGSTTKKHKRSRSPPGVNSNSISASRIIQTRSSMRSSAMTSLKFDDSPTTTQQPVVNHNSDIKLDQLTPLVRLDTLMTPVDAVEPASAVNAPETDQWLATFDAWSPWQQLNALEQLLSTPRCSQAQIKHVHSVCIEPKIQRDFITSLPRELSLLLLTYVRPRDLYKLAQVSKYWYAVANDPILWKNICKRARVTSDDFMSITDVEYGDDNNSTTSGVRACSSSNFHNKPAAITSSSPTTSSSSSLTSPYNYLYTTFNPFKRAYYIDYNVAKNWCTRPLPGQSNLRAHDDHVITCLKFDGRRCLSGSDDNTLKVWCAKTGQLLHTLTGHTGGVWASQLAGPVCVSGSTDRTVRVWNVDTGECVHVLTGHTSTVRCLALHGEICVSGSRDSLLRVWNIRTGECMQVLRGHQAAVRCVCFDGKLVVSGSYDFKIRVWNPFATEPSKACLHVLEGHTNRVYSLLFDGRRIVSGSLDTNILVWDAETGRLVHTLTGHTSLTSGMQLKGDILVSGNADSTVKIWSLRTGQCLHTLSGTNRHMSAVTCLAFNDRYVVSSSDDGTVKLWSLETGEFIRNLLALESGGRGGVVWRIAMNRNMLVCAVGSRIGVEETRLILLDFDWPPTNFLLSLADKRAISTSGHQRPSLADGSYLSASTGD